MLNQNLSWKISRNVTHQKLLCRKMKCYSLWLTSNANKPKCQNNAQVISTTASWEKDLQFLAVPCVFYSSHVRFYFWMKAALIKRFNCLSVCLMVKLLHLLQAWISLPVQFSRLLSILRRCLISVTLAMKANTTYFPFPSSDKSNRLLIFHPQADWAPFNHDISCPLTWIPHSDRLSISPRPSNQPTPSSTYKRQFLWKSCLKFCSLLFFSPEEFLFLSSFFVFSIWIRLSFPNNYTRKEVFAFERLIVLSADKP